MPCEAQSALSFAMSSNGECLAVGDCYGYVHCVAQSPESTLNATPVYPDDLYVDPPVIDERPVPIDEWFVCLCVCVCLLFFL